MSQKVCLLSAEDHAEWLRTGQMPDCSSHRHAKRIEACEMTCHGVVTPYAKPIAKWVGPHHIIVSASWTWRKKVSGQRMIGSTRRHSYGLTTMQLVPGG